MDRAAEVEKFCFFSHRLPRRRRFGDSRRVITHPSNTGDTAVQRVGDTAAARVRQIVVGYCFSGARAEVAWIQDRTGPRGNGCVTVRVDKWSLDKVYNARVIQAI